MTVVGSAKTRVGLSPLQREDIPSTFDILKKASKVPVKYFGLLYHLKNIKIERYYC